MSVKFSDVEHIRYIARDPTPVINRAPNMISNQIRAAMVTDNKHLFISAITKCTIRILRMAAEYHAWRILDYICATYDILSDSVIDDIIINEPTDRATIKAIVDQYYRFTDIQMHTNQLIMCNSQHIRDIPLYIFNEESLVLAIKHSAPRVVQYLIITLPHLMDSDLVHNELKTTQRYIRQLVKEAVIGMAHVE